MKKEQIYNYLEMCMDFKRVVILFFSIFFTMLLMSVGEPPIFFNQYDLLHRVLYLFIISAFMSILISSFEVVIYSIMYKYDENK